MHESFSDFMRLQGFHSLALRVFQTSEQIAFFLPLSDEYRSDCWTLASNNPLHDKPFRHSRHDGNQFQNLDLLAWKIAPLVVCLHVQNLRPSLAKSQHGFHSTIEDNERTHGRAKNIRMAHSELENSYVTCEICRRPLSLACRRWLEEFDEWWWDNRQSWRCIRLL